MYKVLIVKLEAVVFGRHSSLHPTLQISITSKTLFPVKAEHSYLYLFTVERVFKGSFITDLTLCLHITEKPKHYASDISDYNMHIALHYDEYSCSSGSTPLILF